MIKIRIILLSIFFMSIFINSCSDEPSTTGSNLLPEDDFIELKNFDSLTDSSSQTMTDYLASLTMGDAARVLLGKSDGLESFYLVKYLMNVSTTLQDKLSKDSLEVISAKAEFYINYEFGESFAPFNFTVHEIKSDWMAESFTKDSLAFLQYETNDIGLNKIFNDSVISFQLDNDLVLEWLKSKVDRDLPQEDGVLIKPTPETGKILGFQALTSFRESQIPLLKVITRDNNSKLDTLNFEPREDLHLILGDKKPSTNEIIYVQAGILQRGKLWIDVSKIPQYSIINEAILELSIDSNDTKRGTPTVDSLVARFFINSSIDSIDVLRSVFLGRSGSLYRGNISSFVQRWVNGEANEGLLISSYLEKNFVERIAVNGSSNSDINKRPRLKIVYTFKNL